MIVVVWQRRLMDTSPRSLISQPKAQVLPHEIMKVASFVLSDDKGLEDHEVCEIVWARTNTIETPWYELCKQNVTPVIKLIGKCRSTAVGDVIQIRHQVSPYTVKINWYMVNAMGFAQIMDPFLAEKQGGK